MVEDSNHLFICQMEYIYLADYGLWWKLGQDMILWKTIIFRNIGLSLVFQVVFSKGIE